MNQRPGQAEESADAANDGSNDTLAANQSDSADEDSGEWLTLGVYAVESANGEPTSPYLQLTVNRQGEIRGVYYDEISGSSQNLPGRWISRRAWRAGRPTRIAR